ncbi:methyltransferase [Desulfopila sp. IMCC35008]|uniref:methyltransferase n=1 Tax=Desulfopila sp. IMCC35008 TaxID=2653858 RepID=UPI0013D14326|nr:methyltransferase [Desulfopila sp. IMCC35008]
MATIWHPGELLSTSSAYWRGCTLQASVRLRIYSKLADGPLTGTKLAAEIGSDTRATLLLLDALSAMGLLIKKDDTYENSQASGNFLVESSQNYMGHIILHHHHLLDGWAQLGHAVQTGEPVSRRSYGQEVERESFLMGMFNLASQIAPQIAAQIDLSGYHRLLDLGGGPGTFAIHFCKENKDLEAVIFDRPTTEVFARNTISKFDLADRIEFLAGDFLTDPLSGGPYDVAWLSHVLHSNTLEQCRQLIGKCVESMKKGGLILIHDFILDDAKDGPEFPALFSLNMLLANNGGRSYSQKEICDMLRDAGVPHPERHSFRAKNDSSIIYGTVG